MNAADVLERLAKYGIWSGSGTTAARTRLDEIAARLGRSVAEMAKAMARDAWGLGAAIRHQVGLRVLWYARELQDVLDACAGASADRSLGEVLRLDETQSTPTFELGGSGGETLLRTAVLIDNGEPVAVSLDDPSREFGASDVWTDRGVASPAPVYRGGRGPAAVPAPAAGAAPVADIQQAWPRIDAPGFAPAGKPFEVVVGFSAAQQAGVAGGPVTLTVPKGVDVLEVTVDLCAGPGVTAAAGWSRVMKVPVKNVLSAEVRFQLVGAEPATPDRPTLTMLEVRYVLGGTVCGTAYRPLAILSSNSTDTAPAGVADDSRTRVGASPVSFAADEQAPDLTIEILKNDRNAASGHYVCQLYSPHSLTSERGPFDMELGQDAKTFAKSLVDEVRVYANNAVMDLMLQAKGELIAQCLPGPVFDALREVAATVAPAPPAVLVVSAEPYVPWELAWIDPPLDPKRPNYLGAQALVGRWLRDRGGAPAQSAAAPQRPSIHPVAKLAVRNMAVLAAWYKAESGLARLVNAEQEAVAIVKGWSGLPLPGDANSMRQLLTCTLKNGFEDVGGVEAVHFAGHGDFDPTQPDASALYLADGTPLSSTMFRAAKYGGDRQPLLFLNGCMLGIGGDLLGDMAGFPGNSLRGGFGGVIGALWEVDDAVAHDVALDFWKGALPLTASEAGIPVGQVMRDLRANYLPNPPAKPVPTFLSYVYYGHPRLVLQRAGAGTATAT